MRPQADSVCFLCFEDVDCPVNCARLYIDPAHHFLAYSLDRQTPKPTIYRPGSIFHSDLSAERFKIEQMK